MKFRCERDVLGEALATAGAGCTGSGRLPAVLSGVRLELEGDVARDHRDRPRADHPLHHRGRWRADGVCRARPADGRHRAACASARRRRRSGATTEEITSAGARRSPCGPSRPTTSPASPNRPRPGSPCRRRCSCEALRQVVGPPAPTTTRPILTGVLLTAEDRGLRLVATDSYRLAVRDLPGGVDPGRGPEGAPAVRALRSSGPLAPRARSRCGSASGTPPSRSARPGSRPASSKASSRTTASSSRPRTPTGCVVGRRPARRAPAGEALAAGRHAGALTIDGDGIELNTVNHTRTRPPPTLDAKYEGTR